MTTIVDSVVVVVVVVVINVVICSERKYLFGVSKRMSLWSGIAFFLNIVINFIVAGFYPYNRDTTLGKGR